MNDWNTCDVAVIGGGLAGLTAAAFIARSGRSVMLLEQSSRVGGRATTFAKDGFYFNQGPHALYRGAEGIKILQELGVPVRGKTPDGENRWISYRGELHPVPYTLEAVLASPAFSEPARQEIVALMSQTGSTDLSSINHVTWDEWLQRYARHEETRDFLKALARLANYANAPHIQSAGAVLQQVTIGNQGVLYLDGGWQSLIDGLKNVAEIAGVRLIAQASVNRLEQDGDGWILDYGQGNSCRARSVVIAGNPATAAALLKDHPEMAALAKSLVPVRAACLDVGLNHLPRQNNFALGVDRPLYYSLHSHWAQLAPAGGHLIQVAKYLDDRVPQSAAELEAELEAWLEELQPGWKNHVVQSRFLPKIPVTQAVVTAQMGGLPGRPGPRIAGVPNLYLAGDWVGATGMLADASIASAKHAAHLIMESAPADVPVAA